MTKNTDSLGILELMSQPAFCVKDGIITQVNQAAKHYFIEKGAPVASILGDAKEEYAQFQDGCLYLMLNISYEWFSASVTAVDDLHVFVLDPEGDQPALRALALAAQELRNPMSDLMALADNLFPELEHTCEDRIGSQIRHMNRSLYRVLRVIFNMSDAARYALPGAPKQFTRNICEILDEIFKKAAHVATHSQIKLIYHGLTEEVLTLVDEEKLERAVLNMVSNAMKYTKKGGTIEASLTRQEDRLYLSIQDDGSGIPEDVLNNMHRRYRRFPTLDEGNNGVGLGMSLIRACASAHGGAVLVTQPELPGARTTMTIAIRQGQEASLRDTILIPDYAGERDHILVELSDCLPSELFSADF